MATIRSSYCWPIMLSLFDHTWNLLLGILFRYPAILDALRLAAAGLLFTSIRKGLNHVVEAIIRACTMTVYIDQQDEVYDWLNDWAMEQSGLGAGSDHSQNQLGYRPLRFLRNIVQELYPVVGNHPQSLEMGTTGRRQHRHWDRMGEKGERKASAHAPVLARPARDKPIVCEYQGYKVRVAQVQRPDTRYDCGLGMQLSICCGTLLLYHSLIAHARDLAARRTRNSLTIYGPSFGPGFRSTAGWKEMSTRPLRAWDSVILPEGIKEGLLADAREFMEEREFYQEKGVPWRRGYLFHGVPGSGKTSLLAALASKLGLGVYMINLGARDLDDNHLMSLFQDVPPRSILLIEDIDCAFGDRKKDGQGEDGDVSSDQMYGKKLLMNKKKDNSVTLSGLLNALDGVASSEGRLLMCTTNYLDRIDEALSRPGRCDVWIKFEHATKDQAEKLFLHFFGEKIGGTASTTNALEKPLIDGIRLSDVHGLARRFSKVIPEGEVSVSSIQAYLMQYKRRPVEAVEAVEKWVEGGVQE